MNLSISEQLTYSTVRIECELKNGQSGTGTGFFFIFKENIETKTHMPVIITNKHVIKNALRGRIILTKANEKNEPIDTDHFSVTFDDFENLWTLHPNKDVDLCVIPIAGILRKAEEKKVKLFYIPLNKKLLITKEQEEKLSALEDILMIGYPNGIWDYINNMPILRKGTTATHPALNYNGKKEIMIDIAAYPGSSGSPVLIFNKNGYSDKSGTFFAGSSRIILLGILYAGPQATTTGEIVMSPNFQRPISVSHIPINLGLIIKAERILELEKLFK